MLAQVQAPHKSPDRTHAMVFVDQLFDIDASQNKLLPINRNQARNSCSLVRHERSLHTTSHHDVLISSHVPIPGFPGFPAFQRRYGQEVTSASGSRRKMTWSCGYL